MKFSVLSLLKIGRKQQRVHELTVSSNDGKFCGPIIYTDAKNLFTKTMRLRGTIKADSVITKMPLIHLTIFISSKYLQVYDKGMSADSFPNVYKRVSLLCGYRP